MKNNKTICEKGSFIDDVFGEELEYVKIYDGNGLTIIFGCDNKLIIKRFKSTKELIESYITMYNQNEFTDIMFSDLDNYLKIVQDENEDLKEKLKDKKNRVYCINYENVEK